MYFNVKCLIILIRSVLFCFLNVAFSFDSCFEHAVMHGAHPNEQTGNFKCCFTELQSITDVWRMSDRPDQVEKVLPCVVLWVCVIAATQGRSFSVELSVQFPTLLPAVRVRAVGARWFACVRSYAGKWQGRRFKWEAKLFLGNSRDRVNVYFLFWACTAEFNARSVCFWMCVFFFANSVKWIVCGTQSEGTLPDWECSIRTWKVLFASHPTRFFLLRLWGWEWLRSQSNSTPRFCFRRFL